MNEAINQALYQFGIDVMRPSGRLKEKTSLIRG